MKIKNKILYFFKYIIKTKIRTYEKDRLESPYYGFHPKKNNRIWLTVHINPEGRIADFKIKNKSLDIRYLLYNKDNSKFLIDNESTTDLNAWLKTILKYKDNLFN